jgi:CheY-like chemotaxis protein
MLIELVSGMQPLAHQRGVTLDSRVDPDVPGSVVADEGRVRQVLGNLVTNALKFTHHGSVVVGVACDTASSGRLKYHVRDTGIGIAADHLELIFRPFEQVDGTITRRYGGAGLGLSICRRLVELMGGRIGVASEKGQGSTFWFTIPFETAGAVRTHAPKASGVAQSFSARTLVVEDNLVNQIVVREVLQKLGCDVRVAGSGEEALVTLADQPFDLILMDLHMGGIDGIETARRIRAREIQSACPTVSIVALTADAFPQTRDACIASGMNDVLAKPFTLDEMTALLQRVLRRPAEVGAGIQSSAAPIATAAVP